jgi:hypothetical protein
MEKAPFRPFALAAGAVLLLAALGCGTPTASRTAVPPSPSTPAATPASPGPAAAAAADERRSEPPVPAARPIVLVMPAGEAYLVLRSGPEQLASGASWRILYVAGDDADELAQPETPARLASTARDFLDAFHPLAELARVERLSVAALFGRPRGSGAVEERWFARDAGRWRVDGAERTGTIDEIPEVDAGAVRHPEEEAAARDAAAEFFSDAGRADYDAAWAKTSPFVKASMSRTEFEQHLAALRPVDVARGARLYLSFPASPERLLPGTFIEAWLAPERADGSGVQAVTMRLDDDMEWRVAGLVDLSVAPAAQPTALQDTSATRRRRSSTP